jgi:hypothetical protein
MTDALAHLLEHGVLGTVCVLLILVCIRQYNENQKLHKERLEDAKTFGEHLMKQNTDITKALTSNTDALAAQKESSIEARQAFRELSDDLRNRFIRR